MQCAIPSVCVLHTTQPCLCACLYHKCQSQIVWFFRCSILAGSVFHYKCMSCMSPVRTKLYTAQPRGVQEWVLHFCTSLMCSGKWWRTGMLHRRSRCFYFEFLFGIKLLFLVYGVLVDVHKFQGRCNILTRTIFHHLTLAPFFYTPCVVQYMLNDVLRNSREVHKWVCHLCMSLMCTGK